MRALLVLFLLGPGAVAAFADPPAPPAEVEKLTLERFGTTNSTCLEWSDGCAVCTRREDRTIACSLPGIACQPGMIGCRKSPVPAPDTPPK